MNRQLPILARLTLGVLLGPASALATPDFVEHIPGAMVFGEPPGTTARSPLAPREDEPVNLWVRVGYSFYYTNIAVYYTTDGSDPAGSHGVPTGTTSVLATPNVDVFFVRNEPASPANIDWWRCALPASTRDYATMLKYRIGAWHSGGGPEVFANNYGCSDGSCDNPAAPPATFACSVKLAWPGKGSPAVDHNRGYPPVWFWKEEAVVGNNFINAMLDRNGAYYDIHYPGAGGVFGVGTRNEGYADGIDTFPPLTSGRGQMHLNQAMPGLRIGGVTYWLSNRGGADYTDVAQEYVADTNTVHTTARLVAAGNDIGVEQFDLSPRGVAFPLDGGGRPLRGITLKRLLLTNHGVAPRDVNVYFYGDFALNGGDGSDAMFFDPLRGAMVAYDNAGGTANSRGEYNITTFSDYPKNVSVYLAAAMKIPPAVGAPAGMLASDSWRDSSGDQGQGWIGQKLALAPGETREVDIAIVGGFDNFAGATGTYDAQMTPLLDWFVTQSVAALQSATDAYWRAWLDAGVTIDLPDDGIDALFRRSLLATALHIDEKGGGIIAGFHNGAYPFVWPRDAAYAAITLDRTGHAAEAANVYRFLRDVAFREAEPWGRPGFWKQKYTTDGYIVWGAPQVDETAAIPWGVYYHFLATADQQFLLDNYAMCYDAGLAMTQTSGVDPGRLHLESAYPGAPSGQELMYSNNVWEDSYAPFIYSNAAILRGLRDLHQMAVRLNVAGDAMLWNARALAWDAALRGRLAWNGENTDISLLGITYPFSVIAADDPLAALVVDRINGVAADRFGNTHPLMNYPGSPNGWDGLLNRYWGDSYWNGGPWFLSTLWYGGYYAMRQDLTPGKADIDNLKYRLDLCIAQNGPLGFGAEQMAPDNSLMYPGQPDFRLQTAWPNAWESMSTYADACMLFLGFTPDAPAGTLRIEPKLPTGWTEFTYRNLPVGAIRVTVRCAEGALDHSNTFANLTGGAANYDTHIRVPPAAAVFGATQNGQPVPFSASAATGRVHVAGALDTAAGGVTQVRVHYGRPGDYDGNGVVNALDLPHFIAVLLGLNTDPIETARSDMNRDASADGDDIPRFVAALISG